jgi:hypothetical protein
LFKNSSENVYLNVCSFDVNCKWNTVIYKEENVWKTTVISQMKIAIYNSRKLVNSNIKKAWFQKRCSQAKSKFIKVFLRDAKPFSCYRVVKHSVFEAKTCEFRPMMTMLSFWGCPAKYLIHEEWATGEFATPTPNRRTNISLRPPLFFKGTLNSLRYPSAKSDLLVLLLLNNESVRIYLLLAVCLLI